MLGRLLSLRATVPLSLCSDSRGGTRTPDPVINSHLLYQLSYSGKHLRRHKIT